MIRAGIVVTGNRGPDRADRRHQRPLGLRTAGRARGRGRPHPRRRRPPRRPRGGAALPGRRGDGPDRHQRRPRADRGRPHRRGGRPLRRARAGPRRGDGGEDRRDPARLRQARRLRLRRGGGDGGQPQAGDGARGGDRARPGRHRAGAGRPRRRAGRDRPARPAARAAADVAGGAGDRRRCGRCWRGRRRCTATRCGCSACPSRRSPRACARSRPTGVDLGAVEITTCLRRGEIEIDVRYRDEAEAVAERGPRRAGRAPPAPDSSASTARRSTRRWRSCCRAGGWAWPSPAAAACWRRGSPDLPGASDYMAGSVVAYSNEAKAELLGVDPALIEAKGAVSPEVAEAMAIGALERFGADVAVSITGIAGPDGGTEEKPVGYVCFNARLADGTSIARDPVIPGGRERHPRTLGPGRDAPAADPARRRRAAAASARISRSRRASRARTCSCESASIACAARRRSVASRMAARGRPACVFYRSELQPPGAMHVPLAQVELPGAGRQ